MIEVLIDPDWSHDLFGSGVLIDRDWNFDWFGFVVLIKRDWIHDDPAEAIFDLDQESWLIWIEAMIVSNQES